MDNIIINPLEWDTNFFHIKCGRAIIEDNNTNFSHFKRQFNNYDFVSIQNVGNSIIINKKIADYTGAFLADINVQFEKKINLNNIESGSIVELNEDIAFQILKATEVSAEMREKMLVEEDDFKYSKFVCDPELKRRNGYLVYKEWIKNACADRNKYFIVLLDKGDVKAYILYALSNGVCTIELVKVNKEFQGKRIATLMIKKIESVMANSSVVALRVGTQFNNIPAMNLYHSLGFKEISRTSVFHCWRK